MKEHEHECKLMKEMPCQYCNMKHDKMPDAVESLEAMYPEIYKVMYPHVKHHCHMMKAKHGMMHSLCKEELDEMVEAIVKASEKDLQHHMKEDEEHHHRQYGYGPRRFANDLAKILVIRELLEGRPYYGYDGGYNPYYGYPGYPYGPYGFMGY